MAEFVEVMKHKKRMCKSHSRTCRGCRLARDTNMSRYCAFTDMEPAEAEKIIMEWAAAHPKPKYPSWIDGWAQLFPKATNTGNEYVGAPCPRYFIQRNRDKCDSCVDCLKEPMPMEVAKKLGIKPLEE